MVTLVLISASGHGSIRGSKHDLSGQGWGTDEVCKFCHTPHNADKSVAGSPLWNHQVTQAVFVTYSSPTLKVDSGVTNPEQPLGPSKLCLSCHDGTVAIDSYGGRTGTHFISGVANLGTDLSNDHPISINWTHQTSRGVSCYNCHGTGHSGSNLYVSVLPFYGSHPNQTVECGTCHEPHNKYSAYPKMLRKSLNQSEICFHCHAK